MVELLQLVQASMTITAVTITVATAPVAIITGSDIPDLKPLMESVDHITK